MSAGRIVRGVLLALVAINASLLLDPGVAERIARALELDRQAVLGGEAWRLLTGHLVHFTPAHAALDVLVFAILLPLVQPDVAWRAMLLGAAATGVALMIAGPDVYRGASGLDSALLACAAASALRGSDGVATGAKEQVSGVPCGPDIRRSAAIPNWPGCRIAGALALVLLAAKIAIEFLSGSAVFCTETARAEIAPVPLAHALFGAAGIAVAWARPAGIAGRRRAAPSLAR